MKKICVLVSGGGTNLQALIDAEKSGIIKNKIRMRYFYGRKNYLTDTWGLGKSA